jgi:hypothetical protein
MGTVAWRRESTDWVRFSRRGHQNRRTSHRPPCFLVTVVATRIAARLSRITTHIDLVPSISRSTTDTSNDWQPLQAIAFKIRPCLIG